jgi:alkylation response protein AidB-like acyl-CoA dehydrogenase
MTPTPEQLEIQSLARDFAQGELRPHTAEWDANKALDEGVYESLAELGFLGMLIPEEHGGLAFDFSTYLLILEELAWGDATVALGVAIHNGPVANMLVGHGSDEQKARWLPAMASGEALAAFALSEEGAGSDPSAMTTRAERDGDGWILTGEKRWVTNGSRAGLMVVMARTDDEGGIGAFLVEPSMEGFSVTGSETTMGLRASDTARVTLDGVRLGADGLLGEPDQGLRYALEALPTSTRSGTPRSGSSSAAPSASSAPSRPSSPTCSTG